MENVRSHRHIKLITTYGVRTELLNNKKILIQFVGNRIQIFFLNIPIYLGLSILEISKILLYELWYDYVKLKYDEK